MSDGDGSGGERVLGDGFLQDGVGASEDPVLALKGIEQRRRRIAIQSGDTGWRVLPHSEFHDMA